MDIRTLSVVVSHGPTGAEGAGKCTFHEKKIEAKLVNITFLPDSLRNMYCWAKILSYIVVG